MTATPKWYCRYKTQPSNTYSEIHALGIELRLMMKRIIVDVKMDVFDEHSNLLEECEKVIEKYWSLKESQDTELESLNSKVKRNPYNKLLIKKYTILMEVNDRRFCQLIFVLKKTLTDLLRKSTESEVCLNWALQIIKLYNKCRISTKTSESSFKTAEDETTPNKDTKLNSRKESEFNANICSNMYPALLLPTKPIDFSYVLQYVSQIRIEQNALDLMFGLFNMGKQEDVGRGSNGESNCSSLEILRILTPNLGNDGDFQQYYDSATSAVQTPQLHGNEESKMIKKLNSGQNVDAYVYKSMRRKYAEQFLQAEREFIAKLIAKANATCPSIFGFKNGNLQVFAERGMRLMWSYVGLILDHIILWWIDTPISCYSIDHVDSIRSWLLSQTEDVAPKTIESVPVGTRLCAYWSQQYRCLYPGRAIDSESSEGDEETQEKDFVSVEFDDGDSGRISLQNIRFLMSDYPIVEYNDNPLYSLGKQKKTAMKNGGSGSAGSTVGHDTNAVLHDTSLGLSALMLGGDDGDEMYARRTEKKRLKKNPKKKSQQSKLSVLKVSNDTTAAGSDNNNDEHSRKHHKHKKHKKHKKHHRKATNLLEAEKSNSFKLITSSPNHTYEAIDFCAAHSSATENDEEMKVQHSGAQLSTVPAVTHKPIKLEADGVNVKTERMEDIEAEESTSNMMSENSDEAKGDEDDDEIEHNNSKGSKIAAFLPERQLWGWQGMAYRRAGVKGRARKQFYKTIKRGKELITVGDCAVFLSTGRPDRPYIGRIESMWETASSNKVVRVRWFYHPEETSGCPTLKYPGGLFESPHEDENDVQTISHRCEVLPFARYFGKFGADTKQYQSIYDNNDTYYLAGYYNPRALTLNLQDGIPIKGDAILTDKKVEKKDEELQNDNTNTGASIP